MLAIEREMQQWHDAKYGNGSVGPTARKFGEEVGELMEALLSGDRDKIREEAADVGIVLTHLLRISTGDHLSEQIAMKFAVVANRPDHYRKPA